ncbi:adenylyltransferase/cytidyltransferase family protein [bacterium]|nr:adenylyltransferase/cytidyltransferase family protein [bacterium]
MLSQKSHKSYPISNGGTTKFKPLKNLQLIIQELKKEGKQIVFANGIFDVLHVGHIRYLESAKKLGDILVVALNSDSSTKKLKGSSRPIMLLEERTLVISSLQAVDYVTSFDENSADNILLMLKPHIHAKGTDYTSKTVPEKDIVASFGGKIAIVGDPKNHSTKNIIRKIKI